MLLCEKKEGYEMITALGKELRRMRIDSGELLKDMADKLKITPSYLSSIENGKRKPTRDFIDKVVIMYNLTNPQKKILEIAYFETIDEISIFTDNVSNEKKELGLVFARKFNSLDSEQMKSIAMILNKNKESE